MKLSKQQYDEVEAILHSVFDLACEIGIKAIIEAGGYRGCDALPRELPTEGGPYEKAMWTWLNHPDVFEAALRIHQVEQLAW